MKRSLKMRIAPWRLAIVLMASFALTVASFLASTVVLRARARGISTAAEAIAFDNAPSMTYLSQLDTKLRHLEVTLDDFTDRAALGGGIDRGPEEIGAERAYLVNAWRQYAASPASPNEAEMRAKALSAWVSVDHWIDEVLSRVAHRDGTGAEAVLNRHAKPAINVLDDRLDAILRLRATSVAEQGQRILSIRQSVRKLANLLDVACALFAAIAAITVVRIVRRYLHLMENRVSELEHFAGRVAHDIRSPLTAVGLALDITERNPQIDGKTRGIITRGTRTLQRVGQLIDGLLVFARAGAAPQAGVQSDVKAVLSDVVGGLAPSAEEKDVELRTVWCDRALVAAASPGVLASMVSNLVDNAIKYMGEAPIRRVTVRTSKSPRGYVRIEVEDTGPGIPRDLTSKIFDPYVRASQPSVPGLGLGLATVRRLAEGHGGAAGVEDGPGTGSRFWVEIPAAPERESEDRPVPRPAATLGPAQS